MDSPSPAPASPETPSSETPSSEVGSPAALQLQKLCQLLQVAHHIPGRIRVRLSLASLQGAGALSFDELEDFLAALEQVEGIQKVKPNLAALSCTIEYDAAVIASEEWSGLLEAGSVRAHSKLAVLVERYGSRLDAVLPD